MSTEAVIVTKEGPITTVTLQSTRTLVAGASAFDRYFYLLNKKALSASAQRGLDVFRGVAGCASCHIIDTNGSLFTDNKYHSLAVGLSRISPNLALLSTRAALTSKEGARD